MFFKKIIDIDLKQFFKWVAFSAGAGPLSIVLHEGGHALSAFILGYTNIIITFHSVYRIPPVDIQPWEMAITSEAGPIASLIIIVCSYTTLLLRKQSIFLRTLAITATMQFTGGLVYIVGMLFGITSLTEFDGARFAQYLNMAIYIPAIIEVFIFVGSWLYFIKGIKINERKTAISGTIFGGIIGIIIWLTLLGPVLLPD